MYLLCEIKKKKTRKRFARIHANTKLWSNSKYLHTESKKYDVLASETSNENLKYTFEHKTGTC